MSVVFFSIAMFLSKLCVQYKTLTFEEKFATIHEVEKGVKKKAQIAKDSQILPNILSPYLKNKGKFLTVQQTKI